MHFSGWPAKQHRGRSDQCKVGLIDLHDSYGSWHLYICRFLFGLSTFYVASLLFMKGTLCCVTKEKLEQFKVISLHDFHCYLRVTSLNLTPL